MKYILLLCLFCTGLAQTAEQKLTLSSLGYKSAFEYILSKNFKIIKSGSFSVNFQSDKVVLYSVSDCSNSYAKVDEVGYGVDGANLSNDLIGRYVSYIDFSLSDEYKIPLSELGDYFLCFIENEDVTIFRYSGGENSRGGGPLYVIDNKKNKLLEVHYMQ